MNPEPLVVHVHLRFGDLLRGSYYTFIGRSWIPLFILGLPILFFLIVTLLLLSQGKTGVINGYFLMMIAFFLFFLLSPFLSARSAFSNHTEQNSSVYTFDSEGLRRESKAAGIRVPWSGIKFTRETRKSILLYTTPRCFLVIPKSSFSKAEDIDRLRALLSDNCRFTRAVLLGQVL